MHTLDQLQREFERQMSAFHSGYWEIYRSFLRIASDAFMSDQNPDHPRERDYLETLDRYKHVKDAPQLFANMLASVCSYMRETNRECLSELWERFSANKRAGQFFTPWSICDLLAQTQLQGADWDKYTPEKKCTISDPSCGGGRTLIAALKKVPACKLDSVLFHGVDIDADVCYCAALNMLFFNANSVIIHGNTLTLEVWHVYETVHSVFGGEMIEITDPAEMKRAIEWGLKQRQELAQAAPQRTETAIVAAESVETVCTLKEDTKPAKCPEIEQDAKQAETQETAEPPESANKAPTTPLQALPRQDTMTDNKAAQSAVKTPDSAKDEALQEMLRKAHEQGLLFLDTE